MQEKLWWPVLCIALLTVALWPSPAAASCIHDERSMDEKIAEADIVFVGTVIELGNQGRDATFDVHDVWKGEARDGLQIRSPIRDGFTSVDRHFEMGITYLVFPSKTDGGFTDNNCSPTRVYDSEAASHRPADARLDQGETSPTPVETPNDPDVNTADGPMNSSEQDEGLDLPLSGAIAGSGLGLAGLVWVIRRRSGD